MHVHQLMLRNWSFNKWVQTCFPCYGSLCTLVFRLREELPVVLQSDLMILLLCYSFCKNKKHKPMCLIAWQKLLNLKREQFIPQNLWKNISGTYFKFLRKKTWKTIKVALVLKLKYTWEIFIFKWAYFKEFSFFSV